MYSPALRRYGIKVGLSNRLATFYGFVATLLNAERRVRVLLISTSGIRMVFWEIESVGSFETIVTQPQPGSKDAVARGETDGELPACRVGGTGCSTWV